jgi:hypothetical protein
MEEVKKEIEKHWCVYSRFLGGALPSNFGKIVYDSKISVDILYSEGQQYPPQCWDSKYVKRFDSLEEAVEHYINHRSGVDVRDEDETNDEIRERARRQFPSYFRDKKGN